MKRLLGLIILTTCTMSCLAYGSPALSINEQVVSVASGALNKFLQNSELTSFEIRPVGKISKIPHKEPSFTISARNINADKISVRMQVWVDLKNGGNSNLSVPVWFAVNAFKKAFVAKENIGLRKDIYLKDFKKEIVNIALIPAKPLSLETDFSLVQLNKPLGKDHVLTAKHIEKRPAVRSKDRVKVMLESKGIQLETFGVAIKDAAVGDTVLVSPENNLQETYKAKVIGHGIVLVSER